MLFGRKENFDNFLIDEMLHLVLTFCKQLLVCKELIHIYSMSESKQTTVYDLATQNLS